MDIKLWVRLGCIAVLKEDIQYGLKLNEWDDGIK